MLPPVLCCRTEVKSSHIWLTVLLVILMICSTTIALYLTWQHMLTYVLCYRTEVKSSHIWLAVLLVILIICSTTIALYLTWQHMLTSSKEKDKMDFLMVGPTKLSEGLF